MNKNRIRPWFYWLVALGLLSPLARTQGRAPHDQRPKLNLLLITIDTLRADRVGAYGQKYVRTPAIDRLASTGILFTRAFSQASTTLPAHASILLGITPNGHGVHDNANFVVADSLLSLAELLRSAGYSTAAFIGGFPLDSRFGLDQGFDAYDDRLEPQQGEPEPGQGGERRAGAVLDSALAWLKDRKPPWFVWVHFWDPHDPYKPPEPFAAQYAAHPYDGEVAYVDSVLARLWQNLSETAQMDKTCVVLTADHGESLGDHGERTHGFLAYNSTIWVPLIIRLPGLGPRRVPANVSHTDIFPTVCEILGLGRPAGLQGRSLVPAMKGQSLKPEIIYFESLSPYYSLGWAPITGFIREGEKFIDSPLPEFYDLRTDFGEGRNKADPSTVARSRPILQELIRRQLSPAAGEADKKADRETLEKLRSLGYMAGLEKAPAKKYGPQDDVKTLLPFHNQAMRGLDLFKSGKARQAEEILREVITSQKNISTAYINLAFVYRRQGRGDDASAVLGQGLKALPENYALFSQYLTSLYTAGRFREVIDLFQERTPPQIEYDPVVWNYVGLAYWKQGDEGQAQECFARSLAIDKKFAVPHYNLGTLHYFRYKRTQDPGQFQQAVADFRQAIALDPAYGAAHQGLGVTYFQAGEYASAITSLEKALKIDPGLNETLYFLGLAYLRRGDSGQACAYFIRYRKTPAFSLLSPGEQARVEEVISQCQGKK